MTSERRQRTGDPPTVAFQAVQRLEPWKKNVLFVLGVLGVIGLAVWFMVLDRGHTHTKLELIGGAVLLVFFWWAIAPEWVTRQLDKRLPAFLGGRKDRRDV